MSGIEISPKQASDLANGVYAVNSSERAKLLAFLAKSIFSREKGSQKLMKAEVGGRLLKAADDMFGLCAVGSGAYANDIFLIFRGTTTANDKADFVTDARIGLDRSTTGMQVHIGFNHTFNSMLKKIKTFLTDSKTTGRVHCIGHSLGGAVAMLAADWVKTFTSRSVSLYTFGQPRVGLSLFSAIFSRKVGKDHIHRVFHTTDPVPMVPVFPYVHSPLPGYGHRVDSSEPIFSGLAHEMARYETDMAGYANWNALNSAKPLYNHEDGIRRFLKSKAPNLAPNSKTYQMLEDALVWLVAKSLGNAVYGLQLAVMGVHSFIDKAAYVLAKGIKLASAVSEYTMLFIKKTMQVLGMKFKEGVTKVTGNFIRFILEALIKHVNNMAQKAIRSIKK